MGTGKVLVEGKLVKKSFLIEIAAVCAFIFLYGLFYYYPLIDFELPGIHYGIGAMSAIGYLAFAFARLALNLKSNAPHKFLAFGFRIAAAFVIFWMTEGMASP